MQHQRTLTSCGFSPSELLNARQLRTRTDSLLPSPAHTAQGQQSKEASKSQMTADSEGVAKVTRQYKAGDPVYALYHGPRRDKHARWVPAIVKKPLSTRCFNVKVVPHGPVWRRHWDELQPRYVTDEDNEPGDVVDNVSELSNGSSHGDTGNCIRDSKTFQAQDCTTCPRVRTGQSQMIEKDT